MVDAVKTIAAKKEAVYGTYAAPTVVANARLTRNFSATPMEVDQLERNLDLPSRGRSKSAATNKRQSISYELELAGSGAAGTAPRWMEELEACGMAAPVLTAGASAVQRFAAVGAALSSMSWLHYHSDQQRQAVGGRGTFSMDFTAGAYPFLGLQFTAMLPAANAFATVVPGAPDYSAWKDPVEVNTDNTDFTLGGFPLVLRSLRLQANADVKIRNLVGANYVQRGNHAITGTVVGEMPALAQRDYFTSLGSSAEMPLQLIHGLAAGNIIQLDSAYAQLTEITLSEEDNVVMMSANIGLNVRAGSDDLVITAK